ncbi:MAG TPA: hypothetical protein EYP90_05695 [Chromatiaceae bacterium]|nr:hypothetical protein [Chromatiaceae bacterium]HIP73957.1 hypothetical protein [Anaerolineae bacterium]
MEQLAYYIYSLVSKKDDKLFSSLSQEERAASADLNSLLDMPFEELVAYLDDLPTVDWWYSSTPKCYPDRC